MSQLQVMLDLETMSLKPNAAIAQIGAVKFNDKNIVSSFSANIKLKSCADAGLHIDKATVAWWMGQDRKIRDSMLVNTIDLKQALLDFAEWYGKEQIPIWGNGAAFDNVVLRSAYEAVDFKAPWSFRQDRCYRTMKAVLELEEPKNEMLHNALSDATVQAVTLIKALGQ